MFYVSNVRKGGVPETVWVRVDRGTPLGNPFHMKDESQRASVIEKYRVWLWDQIKAGHPMVVRELKRLCALERDRGSVTLLCHCAPRPCHADVIIRALNWMKQR
jgi:hypothetical protein